MKTRKGMMPVVVAAAVLALSAERATAQRDLQAMLAEAAAEGDERGNGGDVLVCRDAAGAVSGVELLDFYEAREMRIGITVDLGDPAEEWELKVARVLDRLAGYSPKRAQRYRQWLGDFKREALFPQGVKLVDVDDSSHLFLPIGCEIEQIAIQRRPETAHDYRYFVSGDLWQRLDHNNRAGLILHELIYRELIELGARNSVTTRYFNAWLASREMAAQTAAQYMRTVCEIGLPVSDHRGWTLDLAAECPYFIRDHVHHARIAGIHKHVPAGTNVIVQLAGPVRFYMDSTDIQSARTAPADHDGSIVRFKDRWYLFSPDRYFTLNAAGDVESYSTPGNQRNRYLEAAHYRLQAATYTGTPDNAPVHLKVFDDGTLRACQSCVGWLEVAGERYEVGIHPRNAYEDDEFGRLTYPSFELIDRDRLRELQLAAPHAFRIQGRDVMLAPGWVRLDAESNVDAGTLAGETRLEVRGQELWARDFITLFADSPTHATLSRDGRFLREDGTVQAVPAGYVVEFDWDGFFVRGQAP